MAFFYLSYVIYTLKKKNSMYFSFLIFLVSLFTYHLSLSLQVASRRAGTMYVNFVYHGVPGTQWDARRIISVL